MTLYTGSGSLPAHIYCRVESRYVRWRASDNQIPLQTEHCVWFGLKSYPGRAWGCHVMLEDGAIVRDLPLNALCHTGDPPPWTIEECQHWDCYGASFSVLSYTYLHGLEARVKCARYEHLGEYLFTACPLLDGFSAEPEQSKEFMFFALANGRYSVQPTNRALFIDRSFTIDQGWPTNVLRQHEVYSCENEES